MHLWYLFSFLSRFKRLCTYEITFSGGRKEKKGPCNFFVFKKNESAVTKKLTFLVSKRLSCLYDKQNNTWLLVDIKFLFSRSTVTVHNFPRFIM